MFVPTNLPMTKRKCTEFYKALPQDLICLARSFLQNIIAVSNKKYDLLMMGAAYTIELVTFGFQIARINIWIHWMSRCIRKTDKYHSMGYQQCFSNVQAQLVVLQNFKVL